MFLLRRFLPVVVKKYLLVTRLRLLRRLPIARAQRVLVDAPHPQHGVLWLLPWVLPRVFVVVENAWTIHVLQLHAPFELHARLYPVLRVTVRLLPA